MYRCFNLNIQDADFWLDLQDNAGIYINRGKNIKKTLQEEVNVILAAVTNEEGIIDGDLLSDAWFPIVNKDIFLSYSHKDEELALFLAGFLNQTFDLSVFVDTIIWGSADSLLKKIDDEFCLQKDGTYNYAKRNFSTSHVHAMLTTSIMHAMDQSEVIFFLNTPNSTYELKDGFSQRHTLSPWIYEEVSCAKLLRIRSWEEHRKHSLNENYHFEKSLNVAYPYASGYQTITFEDLKDWIVAWEKRKGNYKAAYGGLLLKAHEKIIHPLNVLYEMVFGVCQKEK